MPSPSLVDRARHDRLAGYLVVASYVFDSSRRFPDPARKGLVADQELIALAGAQAITGLCGDRQFLGAIGIYLNVQTGRPPRPPAVSILRAA